MSHAGVHKLESAEAADAITLASLRKLAQALDCELHYALVPRTSLAQQLQDRAQTVAQERLRPIDSRLAPPKGEVGFCAKPYARKRAVRQLSRSDELLQYFLYVHGRRQ
jgi:hypothetical protein